MISKPKAPVKSQCPGTASTGFRSCIMHGLLIILFLQYSPQLSAQQETNYAVHANIIYHFTKYINWPVNKKSGDFIIGITGESDLYDELKASTTGKTVNGQKIVIKRLSPSSSSFNCHILFITADESNRIKKISGSASGPVLIVSESPGMATRGACINFTIVRERLRLEINKNNIEDRGLSVATELLQLGTVID